MKNKNTILLSALVASTLSLTGCVIAIDADKYDKNNKYHENVAFKNREKIAQLSLNMTIEDIQKKLGVANFNEAFKEGGNDILVLYYHTHTLINDNIIAKNECTALTFKNGKLESWGEK